MPLFRLGFLKTIPCNEFLSLAVFDLKVTRGNLLAIFFRFCKDCSRIEEKAA